jgi:uncharacterized protein YigE (DUF2233 family)
MRRGALGIALIVVAAAVVSLYFCSLERWRPSQAKTDRLRDGLGALERRSVARGSRAVDLTVIHLDAAHAELVVVDQADKRAGSRLPDALKASGCRAGVNGGFFDAGLKPVGLLVAAGREVSPMATDGPSGVLCVGEDGSVKMLALSDYLASPPRCREALQAGPLVVDPGGKPGIRSRDEKRFRRTVVCLDAEGGVRLLVTGELTLWELMEVLLDEKLVGFKVERALNLDGGPSTALWADCEGSEVSIEPQGPVRNIIGVRMRP